MDGAINVVTSKGLGLISGNSWGILHRHDTLTPLWVPNYFPWTVAAVFRNGRVAGA